MRCIDYIEVSTHAPTRGATVRQADFPNLAAVSTHAPTRGATWHPACARWATPCFNPRAHAGRDVSWVRLVVLVNGFQPTRPRGARR